MKAWREVRFTARIDSGNTNDMAGFLDMLRYEGAVVADWSVSDRASARGGAVYTVTLTSSRFTPDRWSSFDIPTKVISDY